MKLLSLTLLAATALVAMDSPFLGTWKLNADKSSFGPDAPKLMFATLKIEAAGDGVKSSTDAADGQGRADDYMFESPLDGTATKVVNAKDVDSLALKRVDAHTITGSATKEGAAVYSDRRVVSADGNTLTVTRSGVTAEGKHYQSTLVFDKFHN